MKRKIGPLILCAVFLLTAFLITSSIDYTDIKTRRAQKKQEIIHHIQRFRLPFIANEGQLNEQVAFHARTFGGTVSVMKDGRVSYFIEQEVSSGFTLEEEFMGRKISGIKGEVNSATRVSYFKGNDLSQWRSNISTYELINLGEIYDGIGLRLRIKGDNIEKVFEIKPGANPESIQIKLRSANPSMPVLTKGLPGYIPHAPFEKEGLRVNGKGELEVETGSGTVAFTKPIAYQEINGRRVPVEVAYRIENGESAPLCMSLVEGKNPKLIYGFTVASYDTTKELIIDPLLASTYLGGSNTDYISSVAIDTEGNIYVTGGTSSSNFPTSNGAFDASHNRYYDAFVLKFNNDLTALLASTFLGGTSDDRGNSIVIDPDGNIYVFGNTRSLDFPATSGAYDTSLNGYVDTFVSKLSGDLTRLLASTYVGGAYYEYAGSLAIDSDRNIFLGGYTDSPDFPITTNAYDAVYKNSCEVFVSKLNNSLTTLLASTYLGGSSDDRGCAIAIDPGGNVCITGKTSSSDFPTTARAYDNSYDGFDSDVFIARLNGALTRLLASTYLGGFAGDEGNSLIIDFRGNVYVTGKTSSPDFPTTPNAYDPSPNGGSDVFLSMLDWSLTNLLTSTYLGGSSDDRGVSLAADQEGNIYVAGETSSLNFPTTPDAYDTSYNGRTDTFQSKFSEDLSELFTSTYLGGFSDDEASSLLVDSKGNVFLTGKSSSPNFPTIPGSYDTSYGGFGGDAFISKLNGF